MNAAKLEVGQFDLIKNFLLMEAGPDERAVYNLLEEKRSLPQDLYWYWQARIRALVSMHAREEIPFQGIYKAFKEFFWHGPAGAVTSLPFLSQVELWMQGFEEARHVFEQLGLTLNDYRVYGADGYGALLMKLAVVYSSPDEVPRRNELIARMVESLRSYIAVERLNRARMHPRSYDADWTYRCLKASGSGYEKGALAEAIEEGDLFAVYSRSAVDAAIRRWVNEKLEQQGVNNARSIGIADRSAESAEEIAQRYHEIFADKKRFWQIAGLRVGL